MNMTIQKVVSGLQMWDVLVNGIAIERFDTKWEAQEFVNIYTAKLGDMV